MSFDLSYMNAGWQNTEASSTEESDYPLIPEGKWPVVCFSAEIRPARFDETIPSLSLVLEIQAEGNKYNKRKIWFDFAMDPGREYMLSRLKYFLGLFNLANLPDLNLLEEYLDNMVGVPVIAKVTHRQGNNGKTYANAVWLDAPGENGQSQVQQQQAAPQQQPQAAPQAPAPQYQQQAPPPAQQAPPAGYPQQQAAPPVGQAPPADEENIPF